MDSAFGILVSSILDNEPTFRGLNDMLDMDLCCLIDSEERLNACDLVTMLGDLLERGMCMVAFGTKGTWSNANPNLT